MKSRKLVTVDPYPARIPYIPIINVPPLQSTLKLLEKLFRARQIPFYLNYIATFDLIFTTYAFLTNL